MQVKGTTDFRRKLNNRSCYKGDRLLFIQFQL